MKAIVAISQNGVIGKDGKLPWHLSEDLKFFKEKTMGCNLLMGKATYKNLGVVALKGRRIYVLTKNPSSSVVGLCLQDSISNDSIYPDINSTTREVSSINNLKIDWLCGGASMYEQFLPLCSELFVTHVKGKHEGDTYMPPYEHLFAPVEIIKETPEFQILRYIRIPQDS